MAFSGRQRWMLRDDVDRVLGLDRPAGVRLLPHGDAVMHMADATLPRPPTIPPQPERGITTRVVNGLTGRIVLDGDIVGAWGRVRGAFTAARWVEIDADRTAEIEDEAASLVRTVGFPLTFRWVST